MPSGPPRSRFTWALPILALVCVAAGPARGESYAFESLRQPATAQQAVRGGGHACSDEGPEQTRSNPAGLARAAGLQFGASHRSWQFGLAQDWFGLSKREGAWAFGLEAAATHAGSLTGYDEEGNETGSFRPVELIVSGGIGRAIGDRWRLGLAVEYLSLQGVEGELQGTACNVGVEADLLGARFGTTLRHLGPQLAGENGSYPLPTEASVGVELRPTPRGTVTAGLTCDRGGQLTLQGGADWSVAGGLSLLGGCLFRSDAFDQRLSPRAGLEVDLHLFSAAYAYTPEPDGEAAHLVSITLIPVAE